VIGDVVGRLMTDVDPLRTRYGALFENSPTLEARVVARVRVGDHVVDEERVTGANLQGLPSVIHAVVIYRLRAVSAR
jgi:hypothetical protein